MTNFYWKLEKCKELNYSHSFFIFLHFFFGKNAKMLMCIDAFKTWPKVKAIAAFKTWL